MKYFSPLLHNLPSYDIDWAAIDFQALGVALFGLSIPTDTH